MPTFNLRGELEVKSAVGGFFTFSLIALVLYYATSTLVDLYERNSPIINTNIIEDYYDSTDEMDLDESNFRFAIGAKEYYSNQSINDPKYVKWVAKIIGNSDTGARRGFEETIELHSCTK